MSSYRQWYWDGEWHDYPKNKQPFKIDILFTSEKTESGLPNSYVEVSGLDYLKYQMMKYFCLPSDLLVKKKKE